MCFANERCYRQDAFHMDRTAKSMNAIHIRITNVCMRGYVPCRAVSALREYG